MGQGRSGAGKPSGFVPTSTQLRRASLKSSWWPLQADGTAPMPICLEAYGKPYAALAERNCGKCQQEHQKCIRSRKLDPLNLQAWYPVCGESYEIEGACVAALLGEIDKRCCTQLDAAASRLKAANGDHADASLKAALGKAS